MKKAIFFYFLLFTTLSKTNSVWSQIQGKQNKRQTETTFDYTAKIQLIHNNARDYLYQNTDSSFAYATQGYDLSTSEDDKKSQAMFLIDKGNVFWVLGDHPSADSNYFSALAIAQETNDSLSIVRAMIGIGIVCFDQHEYKDAIQWHRKGESFMTKNIDVDYIVLSKKNIGEAFEKMRLLDSAMIYINEAQRIAIANNDQKRYGRLFNDLGNLLKSSPAEKEREYAISYYYKAIFWYSQINDNHGLCIVNLDIARYQKEKNNQIDSIFQYVRQALNYSIKGNFTIGKVDAYDLLIELYKPSDKDSLIKYLVLKQSAQEALYGKEKEKAHLTLHLRDKDREQQIANEKLKEVKLQSKRMQVTLLFAIISTVIIFYFVLRKKRVNIKIIEATSFVGLISLFEFITFLIHPVIEEKTEGNAFEMYGILVVVAILLSPIHHKLQELAIEKASQTTKRKKV